MELFGKEITIFLIDTRVWKPKFKTLIVNEFVILPECYNQVAPKTQWSYCIYLDLLTELPSVVSKGKGGYPKESTLTMNAIMYLLYMA